MHKMFVQLYLPLSSRMLAVSVEMESATAQLFMHTTEKVVPIHIYTLYNTMGVENAFIGAQVYARFGRVYHSVLGLPLAP